MALKPRTDSDGNYLVKVHVDLVVDPAVHGYDISAADLVDLMEAQLTRLDGVLGFHERSSSYDEADEYDHR
jgi:hypothetical protein